MGITVQALIQRIEAEGVVLQSDGKLPSLVTMITGEPIQGSWWGHPKGTRIYNTLLRVGESPDVIAVKLLSGKVTYVHRRLWKPLVAVGSACEEWQFSRLSQVSRRLLDGVNRDGVVRADQVESSRRAPSPHRLARELESRLLVYAEAVHTERGSHAKQLETWRHFSRRMKLGRGSPSPPAAEGKAVFETLLERLNGRHSARTWLPWQK